MTSEIKLSESTDEQAAQHRVIYGAELVFDADTGVGEVSIENPDLALQHGIHFVV